MSTLAFGFYPSKTYTCKARPAISVQDTRPAAIGRGYGQWKAHTARPWNSCRGRCGP